MFLTRAFLDPASRTARADLRNPESLHKNVMRLFSSAAGPSARHALGVLHRLDEVGSGRLVLLIQSDGEPLAELWPSGYLLELGGDLDLAFSGVGQNPAVRDVSQERARIEAGHRFGFRLRANTTRKVDTKTEADGARRNGRRVPVSGDEARIAWLTRHAEAAGFAVGADALRVTEVAPAGGRSQKAITLAGTLFEGRLEVRDADLFRAALATGIGPAKAYGFGLLSVAPLR